ncbi:MAG: chemotaxis protein CheB [Tateyamaria sp.]
MSADRLQQAPDRPYRVVVVDDSSTMRRWLGSIIGNDPRLTLVGTAGSAQEARTVIKKTNPDVLTLDVEMPEMNGLEFLSHLMRLRPMPVVVVAGDVQKNGVQARRAQALGAAGFVAKPRLPTSEAFASLCDSIVAAVQCDRSEPKHFLPRTERIVLIGASTGGVTALERILPQFDVDGPPIVIAQHMPHGFLERLTERLDRALAQDVAFAEPHERLEQGMIRFAPARDAQTALTWHSAAWHVHPVNRRPEHTFCPSVDVLFASAAPWGAHVGALILSGIGNDGVKGMLMLRQNGACTLGQSERSCAVYGMPAAALAVNATQEECDLDTIGHRLCALMADAEGRP